MSALRICRWWWVAKRSGVPGPLGERQNPERRARNRAPENEQRSGSRLGVERSKNRAHSSQFKAYLTSPQVRPVRSAVSVFACKRDTEKSCGSERLQACSLHPRATDNDVVPRLKAAAPTGVLMAEQRPPPPRVFVAPLAYMPSASCHHPPGLPPYVCTAGRDILATLFEAINSHYSEIVDNANLFMVLSPPTSDDSEVCRRDERTLKIIGNLPASRSFLLAPQAITLCSNSAHRRSASYQLQLETAHTRAPPHPLSERPMGDRIHAVQPPPLSVIRWDEHLEAAGHTPPWRVSHGERRPRLLTIIAPASSSSGGSSAWHAASLRLMAQCRRASDAACALLLLGGGSGGSGDEDSDVTRLHDATSRSMYCLEMSGGSLARASVVDSLLLGCIPVFVASHAAAARLDQLWPMHFWWRRNATRLFLLDDVADGTADVLSALERARTSGEAAHMRGVIAAHGHHLVYAPKAQNVPPHVPPRP